MKQIIEEYGISLMMICVGGAILRIMTLCLNVVSGG